MGLVVTLDGPAASGKTSVSREVARRLGWQWLSTGAFYRGLAFVAHRFQTPLDNEQALAELAVSPRWRVAMAEDSTRVFVGSEDVTRDIFQEHVGDIASRISHFALVREALLAPQRLCQTSTQGLVAEGRDCGTVVFPGAEMKFYLTARQEDRAERRAKDLGLSVAETVKTQSQRDQQDSSRKTAPLQIPESAIVVDTTHLNFSEVVSVVENHVRQKLQIKGENNGNN